MSDTASPAATASPVVEITSGKIRGVTDRGVHAFKGVPYGASTAGRNRFMPPAKPSPWSGVRDAWSWAGRAPQAPGLVQRPELAGLPGPLDTLPESEDCLTLNVWTAGLGSGKRPVMLWLHGGAFSYGSANQPRLDGSHLAAEHDVVVVSINQRLNILAHLHLAEIGGRDFAHSGNAGTLDMIAALEWVRDNIRRFGGDAGNVTLFGHSGGGGKISTLMTMPRARGLFHRGIIMSGAAIRLVEPERAAKLADAVLAELGMKPSQLRELQTMPFRQLIAAIAPAQKRIGPSRWPLLDRYDFGPVVDKDLVSGQPFDPKAPDLARDIPIIVGGTKDEAAIFLAPDDKVWSRSLGEDEMGERVARVAGKAADRVVETYRRLHPGASPAERLISTLTDSNFGVRTWLLAERKAAQGGAPVWLYSFDWETPVHGGKLKAYHGVEVPFAFNTIDVAGCTDRSPAVYELARKISTTWATFAHTGRPDNARIPDWPTYNPDRRATMVLDATCRVVDDHASERRRLWNDVLGLD